MENIKHEYTNEIVCPYCGYEFDDSCECGEGCEEDIGLVECDECEKEFYATRSFTITYSTAKAEYGTCEGCGTENILIESQTSSMGNYTGLCEKCGMKENSKYFKKYFDVLGEL